MCKTAKIGSLVDVSDSEDPDGLRVFYYLVQDLKVRSMFSFFLLDFPFVARRNFHFSH